MFQQHDFPARALSAMLLLGFSCASAAQEHCDCTSIVDSCRAEVTLFGDRVEITSDSQQCSRVDYFVDGQPFVALVLGGEHSGELAARAADRAVLIQSCQVCRERPMDTQLGAAPLDDTGVLQPLIQVTPIYPDDARSEGVEGYVELELTVTPEGRVGAAAITAAQPPGVFDLVTLAAVDRWRYPADLEREPSSVSARVEFRLDEAMAAAPAPPRALDRPSIDSGAPRNQCLRESAAYDYGGAIDVDLVSACEEPLLVYGCARGTGRHAGRWVCFDSEQRRALLVRPRDPRLGESAEVETFDGAHTFRFNDSFLITRAPNSQYLWIACPAADTACRAPARQWARSVNLQPDQVDPRHRTHLPLARSQ